MTRQLRLEFPGALWHVTSRGNERRDIVRDDHDRLHFVSLLGGVVNERRWLLHAWVLMSNHYHLLVETPQIGLSQGVKKLNQDYAMWFNDRHERVGHLFQGRFKGILVERETHLLELVRYIVLNPVRSGMVGFPEDYEWSNYRATAGLQPVPEWLEVDWTLKRFAGDPAGTREAYRRFVAAGRGGSYEPWASLVGQIYLGSETFRDAMQLRVDGKTRSREHPRPQRAPAPADVSRLRTMVVEEFGVSIATLLEKSRGHARKALAHLAARAGLPDRAVADALGVSEIAALKMRRAARTLYSDDPAFRDSIDRIRAKLS